MARAYRDESFDDYADEDDELDDPFTIDNLTFTERTNISTGRERDVEGHEAASRITKTQREVAEESLGTFLSTTRLHPSVRTSVQNVALRISSLHRYNIPALSLAALVYIDTRKGTLNAANFQDAARKMGLSFDPKSKGDSVDLSAAVSYINTFQRLHISP